MFFLKKLIKSLFIQLEISLECKFFLKNLTVKFLTYLLKKITLFALLKELIKNNLKIINFI